MRQLARYAFSMACSANLMIPIEKLEQQHSCRAVHTLLTEGYLLSYHVPPHTAGVPGRDLMLHLLDPDGNRVVGAQVIVTTVDALGNQRLARAVEGTGGYTIDLNPAAVGFCHIEIEVITGGLLLTDYFTFELGTAA